MVTHILESNNVIFIYLIYCSANPEDYEYGVGSAQVLNDLSEVERDLQLRCLLWESSEDWGALVQGWTVTQFDKLNVDVVQKNVTKFTQTVFMLEKGTVYWWLKYLSLCLHEHTCKMSVTIINFIIERIKMN